MRPLLAPSSSSSAAPWDILSVAINYCTIIQRDSSASSRAATLHAVHCCRWIQSIDADRLRCHRVQWTGDSDANVLFRYRSCILQVFLSLDCLIHTIMRYRLIRDASMEHQSIDGDRLNGHWEWLKEEKYEKYEADSSRSLPRVDELIYECEELADSEQSRMLLRDDYAVEVECSLRDPSRSLVNELDSVQFHHWIECEINDGTMLLDHRGNVFFMLLMNCFVSSDSEEKRRWWTTWGRRWSEIKSLERVFSLSIRGMRRRNQCHRWLEDKRDSNVGPSNRVLLWTPRPLSGVSQLPWARWEWDRRVDQQV